MNTHIFSTSPQTTFGLYFPHQKLNTPPSYEIDEHLFEALDVSQKSRSNFITDVSPCLSEEESDSSCKYRKPKQNKHNKRRDIKHKKEEKKPTEDDKKQKNLYKTELCRNWEETGHCRYGLKCQYAHGAADLREVDRHPKYKTQKCRTFHQTGACPYGSRCTFRHFNLPGDEDIKKEDKVESSWFEADPEDSLLPSNAESLLPHQLLFDLESPVVSEPSRCPLLSSLSHQYSYQPPMNPECKTFFRPWLF